jgi:hypothetical protein
MSSVEGARYPHRVRNGMRVGIAALALAAVAAKCDRGPVFPIPPFPRPLPQFTEHMPVHAEPRVLFQDPNARK